MVIKSRVQELIKGKQTWIQRCPVLLRKTPCLFKGSCQELWGLMIIMIRRNSLSVNPDSPALLPSSDSPLLLVSTISWWWWTTGPISLLLAFSNISWWTTSLPSSSSLLMAEAWSTQSLCCPSLLLWLLDSSPVRYFYPNPNFCAIWCNLWIWAGGKLTCDPSFGICNFPFNEIFPSMKFPL